MGVRVGSVRRCLSCGRMLQPQALASFAPSDMGYAGGVWGMLQGRHWPHSLPVTPAIGGRFSVGVRVRVRVRARVRAVSASFAPSDRSDDRPFFPFRQFLLPLGIGQS